MRSSPCMLLRWPKLNHALVSMPCMRRPVPQDLPQGMQGMPQHMPYQEEEVVRAPLPVMRDRLYGNDFAVRRGVPPPDAPREVEAFRDFRCAILIIPNAHLRPPLYSFIRGCLVVVDTW